MRLGRFLLCAIVGSMLIGWRFMPPAQPTPGAADFRGPCSQATRGWAEEWRRTRPGGRRDVRRVSVLCLPDGRAYSAALAYWDRTDGYRRVSWRPVTTFIGVLPPHSRERIDSFDMTGRLAEYAILDREVRRVEFYSAASQPTGYGRFDPSSQRIERFSPEGRRQGSLGLPFPPPLIGW